MLLKLSSLYMLKDRWRQVEYPTHITVSLPRFFNPKTLLFPDGRGAEKKQQQSEPERSPPSSSFPSASSTAYLDALRGYAAWIVFLAHGWDEFHFSATRQPILSIIVAAKSMVALFFVISGYVLSYRLLVMTHDRYHRRHRRHYHHRRQSLDIDLSHDHDKILQTLAGSTFRRGVRLWGSSIFALSISGLLVCMGWDGGYGDDRLRKDTLWEQIADWFHRLAWFMNPFVEVDGYFWGGTLQNEYLGPMWTIPVEIRGSMILFLFLVATCMMSFRKRAILTWTTILACYFWTKLYVAQFLMGMAIADVSLNRQYHYLLLQQQQELDQERRQRYSRLSTTGSREPSCSPFYVHSRTASSSSSSSSTGSLIEDPLEHYPSVLPLSSPSSMSSSDNDEFATAPYPVQSRRSKIIWIAVFATGIFLLGQPDPSSGDDLGVFGDFPWKYLHAVIPSQYDNSFAQTYFYLGIGGFLLILALEMYPVLRTPLNTPFSQYVGDLSFGIYAMHPIIVIMVIRQWYEPCVRAQLFGHGFWAHVPGMVLTHGLVFTCADYFSRVDYRVVVLARRVQAWFFDG
ncbi:hypothetical protein PV08_09812 [Exophiala spinifera]|uniref:Acyltransferase 3 domain-containing protein n=1 Tax=Exophiala spinifera TaxID=91928 RepID=A0A0D2B1P7_9EURO|nr:uncharacterized protein PV08_09812 [Exophiala spinifera]KIW12535.1 hypothetical protein PV08_09812 [Exophiala spinifera]